MLALEEPHVSLACRAGLKNEGGGGENDGAGQPRQGTALPCSCMSSLGELGCPRTCGVPPAVCSLLPLPHPPTLGCCLGNWGPSWILPLFLTLNCCYSNCMGGARSGRV